MGLFDKIFKGVAGFIPGASTALDVLGIAGGLIGGNKAQGKSNDMLKRAMALKQQGWDQRAPLRASSLAMAQQPMVGREDLSSVFSDPGNPYARTLPRPMGGELYANRGNTATPIAPIPQTPQRPRGGVLQRVIADERARRRLT